MNFLHGIYLTNNVEWFTRTDFPKLAEKLSVIRTDRHENLVSPKKNPQKFTVTWIKFSLAFLE